MGRRKVRCKAPERETSAALKKPSATRTRQCGNLAFASAVAEFGHASSLGATKATPADPRSGSRLRFRGNDPEGYRAEFIKLADLASALHGLR